MPKKRNNDGQYVKTATLEDVGAAFGAVDGPPVVTTADVADETGLSRDSARRKLERLRERDEVARRREKEIASVVLEINDLFIIEPDAQPKRVSDLAKIGSHVEIIELGLIV